MEGGQLYAVKVLRPHFIQHLLKRVELAVGSVHILLIHLQGKICHINTANAEEMNMKCNIEEVNNCTEEYYPEAAR